MISPELLAMITQSVRAAIAVERAKDLPVFSSAKPSTLVTPTTGVIPSSVHSSVQIIMMALGNLLPWARILQVWLVVILLYHHLSLFSTPSMSLAMSCLNIASSLAALLHGMGSSVALTPSLPSHLDQPFVVGPVF